MALTRPLIQDVMSRPKLLNRGMATGRPCSTSDTKIHTTKDTDDARGHTGSQIAAETPIMATAAMDRRDTMIRAASAAAWSHHEGAARPPHSSS